MNSTNTNQDWLDTDPSQWKPEQEGESIQGILVSKTPKSGERSAIYHIQDSQDNLHIVWGSAVMDRKMDAIEENEEVKITFEGTKPSKKGKHPTKLFKVLHRKTRGDSSE